MSSQNKFEKLKELLLKEEFKNVFTNDGKILAPSSQIFKDVSNALPKDVAMSAKYIYTVLKSNRYKMCEKMILHHGFEFQINLINNSLEETIEAELCFTIDLSSIWSEIAFDEKLYDFKSQGVRKINTLKSYKWTDILYDKIYDETNITCPLAFKKCCTTSSGIYLKVEGYCNECDSIFEGCVVNEPRAPSLTIEMECVIKNYDKSFKHTKKRQLKGYKRKQIGSEMVDNKILPSVWRREKAAETMDLGDAEPPNLYSGRVLRKLKQEYRDMKLGIKSADVFESLQLLKYSNKYEGAVKSIGLDPLYIHYWTAEQTAVYEKCSSTICIDATGSIIKKVKLANGELSPHIYLYQMVAKAENSFLPICQMLSASQNTNSIAFWLFEFLRIASNGRKNFPYPQEVVTDFDRALIGGVVRAFGKQNSLSEYLEGCFDVLLGNTQRCPATILRLDVCHFMNMLAKWKCFRTTTKHIKFFYLRSMAALRKQKTLKGVEQHAKAIFIMASHELTDNEELAARQILTASIQGIVDFEEPSNTNVENENLMKDDELAGTNIFAWVAEIYNSSTEINDTNSVEPNAYYCLEVAKNLKNLLPYFPLFSEVMPTVVGYGTDTPTSASVESEFNDLKNRILKDSSKPMRIDKFICHHINSFPGKIRLAMAPQCNTPKTYSPKLKEIVAMASECDTPKTYSPKRTKIVEEENFDHLEELRAEQNWRNKNETKKVVKYIDPYPQFNLNFKNSISLPIIKNANLLPNTHFEKAIYVVNNTCALDALCQIVASSLANNVEYKNDKKLQEIPIHKLLIILIEEGLTKKFYFERIMVLIKSEIFDISRYKKNIIKINAVININELCSSIFKKAPSLIKESTCEICLKTSCREYSVIAVNIEILKREGFGELKEAIASSFFHKNCCGKEKINKFLYGPHIVVATDTGCDFSTKLEKIPTTLVFGETIYRLQGVITYTGSFKINTVGHYSVHQKINQNWILIDGSNKSPTIHSVSSNKVVHAHTCFYIKTEV